MNKWVKRADREIGMPKALSADDQIRYRLEGDPKARTDAAGNLAWDGVDGEGRVEEWAWLDNGVGDVNGTTMGSGARFNGGKPDLSLIPAGIITRAEIVRSQMRSGSALEWPTVVLEHLGRFQMRQRATGEIHPLLLALAEMNHDGQMWAECAEVFEYGKAKYSAWNWARGQAWSIPIASGMRHIVLGALRGEDLDPESGKPHRGHVACNIVMLLWFEQHYKEGDDRFKWPSSAA